MGKWSTWQWVVFDTSQFFWSLDTPETPWSASVVFADNQSENKIWNRVKQFLPVLGLSLDNGSPWESLGVGNLCIFWPPLLLTPLELKSGALSQAFELEMRRAVMTTKYIMNMFFISKLKFKIDKWCNGTLVCLITNESYRFKTFLWIMHFFYRNPRLAYCAWESKFSTRFENLKGMWGKKVTVR